MHKNSKKLESFYESFFESFVLLAWDSQGKGESFPGPRIAGQGRGIPPTIPLLGKMEKAGGIFPLIKYIFGL